MPTRNQAAHAMAEQVRRANVSGNSHGHFHDIPVVSADARTLRQIRIGLLLTLPYQIVHLLAAHLVSVTPAAFYGVISLDITITSVAAGLTYTVWCRRRWRELAMFDCVAMVDSSVAISIVTGLSVQSFVAAVLMLLGAAALVPWGWRWQATLIITCLVSVAVGSLFGPSAGASNLYLWLELLSAAGLAQFIAIAMEAYRGEIEGRIQELRASEAKLLKIFDANPDPVAVARLADHRFIEISREFLKSGFSREEVLGATDRELGIWCSDATRSEFWQRLETRGYVRNLRADFRAKGGQVVPCTVSAMVTELRQGSCVIWEIRNIEAILRAERALVAAREAAEAASKAKSSFLSTMAHEIRTPMNAILGMAELLADGHLSVDQRKYLSIMANNGNALLDLINDILDLARIDTGSLTLERTSFDLRDLSERVAETFSIRAHQKGLELALRIRPGTPTALVGDPLRLRQILVNLVGNALKFTYRGEIVMTAWQDDDRFHFTVSDTGIGIPPEKQEMIFAGYAQADPSTARLYGGSGLGLAIVKQLVELMGGHIWVESKPEEGSTFHFTAALEVDPKGQLVSCDAPLSGVHVLIADHTPINLTALAELLAAEGALTCLAGSAEEAISRVHAAVEDKSFFDLALLDNKIIRTGWRALLKALRAQCPNLLVVPMLTAHDLSGQLPEVRNAGLQHQLIKPVRRAELLHVIREALCEAAESGRLRTSSLRPTIGVEQAMPVQAEEAAPDQARTPDDSQVDERRLRVLVADDSADNRILLEAFLKKAGWEIEQAENGEEAVRKFTAGKYDIVLMDIQMPVLDGYEAVRRIRDWERAAKVPRTPVIALTASVLNEAINKSIEAGCDTHVSKPVRRPALLATIREVVARNQGECGEGNAHDSCQSAGDDIHKQSWSSSRIGSGQISRIH